MLPTLSRRRMLTLLAVPVVTACSARAPRAASPDVLPPFDALSTPELGLLGRAVNRDVPGATRIARDLLATTPVAQRRAVLDQRSRADARLDRTVEVDGWVLPIHLAGLAGLYGR